MIGHLENGDLSLARLAAETGATWAVQGALLRYIRDGSPVGGFLTALLSNDLKETCARADWENRPAIPALVLWLYNEAPASCWGSPAAVEAWLARGEEVRKEASGG